MKKKYSLALWWWAARWLVHIWVIKYLTQNNIEIIEVAWVSMGAIIAALFSIWKSTDEIIEFAKSINYLKLIDFQLSSWIVLWDKIYKKLETIFLDKKIEDQKIKLKIVATNIISWRKKVFTEWKIVDALRASISLPWIFIPYEINGELYVDWWITNNLPIEILNWKNIIAVTALRKINWPLEKTRKVFWMNFKRQFLNLSYQILHRTVLIMMKQNELRSLETNNKNIILIDPEFWELDFYSFNKIDEFIELWYKETFKIFSKKTILD